MMAPRFSLSLRLAAPGLALLFALSHVTIALAQGHTADPYRPYNSVYDPYVFPTYPRADGYFPNQDRLEARSGPSQANQFQNFLDENRLGADPSGLSGSSGAGIPYYRAHRRFDPANRPNNSAADRLFREKQEDRDTKYFEARKKYQAAVNERNPQKRARLIQEYAEAKRLAEQDFRRTPDPAAPGRRTTIGSQGTNNPPTPRRPSSTGPLPSSSPTPPVSPRVSAPANAPRPRSSLSSVRPGEVGFPRAARTPSQVLQESESLDRSDPLPTPPARPRLQPAPAPR